MVRCPICEKEFQSLGSHVRRHGFKGGTFQAAYPDTPMTTADVRERTSRSCKEGGVGLWRRGQRISEEGRKNLSAAMTGAGNGFYGRKHTAETRRLMSENHADFTGDKNPFKRSLADPAKRQAARRRGTDSWREIQGDPQRYAARTERMSEAMSRAHAEGRMSGFGRGHEHGWFTDLRDGQRLFYRSSYERQFLEWCVAQGRAVVPCSLIIPYVNMAGQRRRYLPDFLVDGRIVVEIKPKGLLRWKNNPAKFAAGQAFCEGRGLTYVVVTEDFLNTAGSELPRPA